MQSHLPRMHKFFTCEIQCQFVDILLKRLKQMIVAIHHTFVQLLFEHRSKASGRRCQGQCLCRASKPSKPVALLDSTYVSIGWILSSIGGSSSIRIVPKTSSTSSQHNYTILFVVCVIDIRKTAHFFWFNGNLQSTHELLRFKVSTLAGDCCSG